MNIDVNRLWIITYHHRYGTDSWLVLATKRPELERVVSEIDNFEPEYEEYVEVFSVTNADIHDYDKED